MEILLYPILPLLAVPGAALAPGLLLALAFHRRRQGLGALRRAVAVAACAAWLLYGAYETWMYFWMQTVIAPIRVDLLLIAPLLYLAAAAGLLAVFAGRRRGSGRP